MSILKYKYKAHRLVNTLFYVIVFVIGFLLGFTSNKIDFSKLLSNVLMIDSVSAYDFEYEDKDILIEDFEEWIINNIPTTDSWSDFSFEDYNKVIVKYGAYNKNPSFNIHFYKDETLPQLTITEEYIYVHNALNNDYYNFRIYADGNYASTGGHYTSSGNLGSHYYVSTEPGYFTNFDLTNINNTSTSYTNEEINERINLLDFEGSNLQFNENLFKDNPDFKEVCVEEGKSFAITSTEMSDINSVYDFDYIWFPYNLNGLSKILYDNSVDTNEIHYTEEEAKERYFFNTKENIDNYFSSDIPGLELEVKGYTDKYSYYGWSAWPFRVYYSETYNQFNIFELKEPTKIYIGNLGSSGSVHGGGGTRLDFDEEIEKNEYCFHIKKQYEVTSVNVDEFNDYYGTVPTPNGDLDFSTSFIKDNIEASGLMSQVNTFISKIKGTLDFIGDYIYEFYLSMPLLLRMFFISILVILIVKFIIGMVVR